MKTSKFTALLMLSVAYFVGFAIGGISGFNPAVSGLVSVGGSAMIQHQSGVLAAGLDVSTLAADLGSFLNVPKNASMIWNRLYQELELMQYMRKISGQKGSYAGIASSSSELMQPFQKAFTAKGDVAFTPYLNTIYRAKVDFLIDNIDEIVDSYVHFFADETKERKDWPLVKYIVSEHFIPQLVEEMNTAMCRGVYAAPTPGTAGNSVDTMNGLLTIVANEITATNIVPIVTGVTNATNAVDNFETFANGIDSKYTDKGGVIFCSKTMERFYKQDYRSTFGATNDQMAKNNTKLDNYDIQIVGLSGFGASQRMIFTPTGAKGNLLYLYDKIFTPSTFETQADKRDVVLLADWHMAVGLSTLDAVYANDQA